MIETAANVTNIPPMVKPLVILQGDWIEQLRTLPDSSVHCCVTSPPYWGLRDYGVAGQLGLEKTPEEYVGKLVEGFKEVRRVLRDDGTLWLNLGDSYARQAGDDSLKDADSGMKTGRTGNAAVLFKAGNNVPPPGLKPKDLVGIPWRVAFALQADGWWLRSDIIWHKPNPMPESVTDRPTKAHEYIFLLAKNERYFWDAEAVKENGVIPKGTLAAKGSEERWNTPGVNSRPPEYKEYNGFRNKRTVWTIPSQSYPESHFATFPEALVKPCILAGTSAKGCCPKCGAPWERVLKEIRPPKCQRRPARPQMAGNDQMAASVRANGDNWNGPELAAWKAANPSTSTWQQTCKCDHNDTHPCTVLDPFGGSGTTGQVALELGRNAILIELNPDYIELIKRRTDVTQGLAL